MGFWLSLGGKGSMSQEEQEEQQQFLDPKFFQTQVFKDPMGHRFMFGHKFFQEEKNFLDIRFEPNIFWKIMFGPQSS